MSEGCKHEFTQKEEYLRDRKSVDDRCDSKGRKAVHWLKRKPKNEKRAYSNQKSDRQRWNCWPRSGESEAGNVENHGCASLNTRFPFSICFFTVGGRARALSLPPSLSLSHFAWLWFFSLEERERREKQAYGQSHLLFIQDLENKPFYLFIYG